MSTLLLPRWLRSGTALALLVYWSALHVAPAAAGLAPSRPTGESRIASVRDADLILVRQALEHRIVAQKLRDYGVPPQQVELRLASLSDEDLHTLATACKGLPSGSDDIGAVIGLLVIVLLVIVILKLLNKEIIVK